VANVGDGGVDCVVFVELFPVVGLTVGAGGLKAEVLLADPELEPSAPGSFVELLLPPPVDGGGVLG
jgi:hypothetical protein